jgi:hypothetical protein
MIISGIHHLGHDRPPRDPCDRAPIAALPDDGTPLWLTGVDRIAPASSSRVSAIGHPTSGRNLAHNRRNQLRRARAAAALALTPEDRDRQLLAHSIRRRCVVAGGHYRSPLAPTCRAVGDRLQRRIARHRQAARRLGVLIVCAGDSIARTPPDSPAALVQRSELRALIATLARRWGGHIRTAHATEHLAARIQELDL